MPTRMVDRSYLLKTVQSMPQLKTVRKSREKMHF